MIRATWMVSLLNALEAMGVSAGVDLNHRELTRAKLLQAGGGSPCNTKYSID